jgi:peptidoglycan LD-endopeptidase CwlK
MYKFGDASISRIGKVHQLLQRLANGTIEKSDFDFGIPSTGGLRTTEEQYELFKKGNSQCDGTIKKSYHQTGLALDFVPYINGKYTWENKDAFLSIAKTAFDVWEKMDDKQGMFLHWGGFWTAKDLNGNGLLDINDQLGWDLPHFELRNYAQVKGVYPIDRKPSGSTH